MTQTPKDKIRILLETGNEADIKLAGQLMEGLGISPEDLGEIWHVSDHGVCLISFDRSETVIDILWHGDSAYPHWSHGKLSYYVMEFLRLLGLRFHTTFKTFREGFIPLKPDHHNE